MQKSKLYSDHIKYLADILQQVKLQGVEKDHRDIYPKHFNPMFITVASPIAEVTMNGLGSDITVETFNFLRILKITIWQSYEDQEIGPQAPDAIANISRLVGQYIDLVDCYDVLDYLGYSLPDRDEWEALVNDSL